ncbi:MAG: hypothetical protein QF502_04400 [Nitrospinaceae bacterium]|nr:hypothetical protein [Nitrospinaceae bacterium]
MSLKYSLAKGTLADIWNSDFSMLSILVLGCLIQFYLGFANPAYPEGNKCWRPIFQVAASEEVMTEGTIGDKSLVNKFATLFPEYRMNCDDAYFLRLVQRGFPESFSNLSILMDQPLYPLLIFLVFKPIGLLFDNQSMSVIFASAMAVNLLLMIFGVLLFYYLLKDLFSPKVAFLSSVLLIFSPLTHVMLVQSTSTGIMEVFIIIAYIYLLNDYAGRPGQKRLVMYSILAGILMTGKMIFSLGIFVICLGIYFKRIRETVLFFVIHLVPLGIWYLFVEWGLGIKFEIHVITDYNFGIWLFDLFSSPWSTQLGVLINVLPQYFESIIYGFMMIPVILSCYGLHYVEIKHKYLIYSLYLVSFLILFFIMNVILPRLSFFLFPIIYPTAVIGLKNLPHARFFSPVIYTAIIIISNINVYKILEYG